MRKSNQPDPAPRQRQWEVTASNGTVHLITAGMVLHRKDAAIFLNREPHEAMSLMLDEDDVVAVFTSPVCVLQKAEP